MEQVESYKKALKDLLLLKRRAYEGAVRIGLDERFYEDSFDTFTNKDGDIGEYITRQDLEQIGLGDFDGRTLLVALCELEADGTLIKGSINAFDIMEWQRFVSTDAPDPFLYYVALPKSLSINSDPSKANAAVEEMIKLTIDRNSFHSVTINGVVIKDAHEGSPLDKLLPQLLKLNGKSISRYEVSALIENRTLRDLLVELFDNVPTLREYFARASTKQITFSSTAMVPVPVFEKSMKDLQTTLKKSRKKK